MPTNKTRNGNGFYMRASFEKAHGTQAQGARMTFAGQCYKPKGQVVVLLTGGSGWKGKVQDWQQRTDSQEGITTEITAVDVRDALWDRMFFGKINMIDERTGEVYCGIVEDCIPAEFRVQFMKTKSAETKSKDQEVVVVTSDGKVNGKPLMPIDVGYMTTQIVYSEGAYKGQGVSEIDIDIGLLTSYDAKKGANGYGVDYIGANGIKSSLLEFLSKRPGYDSSTGVDQTTGIRHDLLRYETETHPIYPRDLLDYLCAMCGFKTAYTPSAYDRLKSTEGVDWKTSVYNIYNLDWSNGIKVGAAIQTICDALGLICSPTNEVLPGDILPFGETPHDFNTIRFYVQGAIKNSLFSWDDVTDYNHHDIGEAIQNDVDTGLWIIGDQDRIEFKRVRLLPAWNQSYNEMFWDLAARIKFFNDAEIDMRVETLYDVLPAIVQSIAQGVEEAVYQAEIDAGKTPQQAQEESLAAYSDTLVQQWGVWEESGFFDKDNRFEDMTVDEYFRTVPFRVYRMEIMDKVLKTDELDGTVPVRRIPIATPLITNPTRDCKIYGRGCRNNRDKLDPNNLWGLWSRGDYTDEDGAVLTEEQAKAAAKAGQSVVIMSEIKDGYKLYQDTGLVVFTEPQYKLLPKDSNEQEIALNADGYPTDEQERKKPLRAKDILPDDRLEIDVVLLGETYRSFWGTEERIGSKNVSNLHRKMIAEKDAETKEYALYLYEDDVEKNADEIANDIAIGFLSRQRRVRSGSIGFEGIAGHEPDELIRRVSITIDANTGISETMQYSNDKPSFEYPSYWEIQNKIALDNMVKRLEQDKKNEERKFLMKLIEQRKLERKTNKDVDDPLVQATIATLGNTNNWISIVPNADAVAAADKLYDSGEPVCIIREEE